MEILVDHLKLAFKYKSHLKINTTVTTKLLKTLRSFFHLKDLQIEVFDLSKVENEDLPRILDLLKDTKVKYTNFSVFEFGERRMSPRIFILIAKWLLWIFSLYQDNDHLEISDLLFNKE